MTTEFIPLELDQLRREAAVLKADGWRFIQTHAVYTDDGVDLYYSFMKDGHAANYWIKGIRKDMPVPSITDLFLAAFVFENEARELFGVDMRDIAIDFAGAMYAPAVSEPMTIISPEQKAARDKARKAAAAKAAKEQAAADGIAAGEATSSKTTAGATGVDAPSAGSKRVFVMTPELQARLDAKLPTLSDEKRAKIEAALKARAAEAQAAKEQPPSQNAGEVASTAQPTAASTGAATKGSSASNAARSVETQENPKASLRDMSVDSGLEKALSALDPAKAARVRDALAGKTPAGIGSDVSSATAEDAMGETAEHLYDEQLESLIATMDSAKAAVVRAAFAAKGGN